MSTDLLSDAYLGTNRAQDEELCIAAVASFSLRADIREHLLALDPEDFFKPAYGRIWESARKLADTDRIITLDNMRPLLSTADHRMLTGVYGQGVRLVEVKRGVEYIRQAAKRRRFIDALKRIASVANESEGYADVLAYAHGELSALDGAESSASAVDIDAAIDELWDDIENPKPEQERFVTPWPDLDEVFDGGTGRGELVVWAADTGNGKSVAMLNCAGRAALNGKKVAIFSLEMGVPDVTNRLVAAESGERIRDIKRRQLTDVSSALLRDFTDVLREKTLRIFDAPDATADYIRQQCMVMKRTVGLDVVVIDYIQIANPGAATNTNREGQISKLTIDFKVLARALDVTVHTASQMNDNEVGTSPTVRSLRESKAIGHHADAVVMITHELDERGDKSGSMFFHIVKNRRGRTTRLPMIWEAHKSRIAQPQGWTK